MQDQHSSISDFFHQKWVIISLIIFFIILIAAIATPFIRQKIYSSTLLIVTTPTSATVTIDGQSYQNGTYSFIPSSTTATISASGFKSKTINLDLTSDKLSSLFIYLLPENNDFSFFKQIENFESLSILQQLSGFPTANSTSIEYSDNITTDQDTSADTFLEKYSSLLTIKTILPLYQVTEYSQKSQDYIETKYLIIDDGSKYDFGCKTLLCLVVSDSTGTHHDDALNTIKTKGFDPADYEIIYTKEVIHP